MFVHHISCRQCLDQFIATHRQELIHAGLVLRFDIAEGVEVPESLHYGAVKEAFGGKVEGVVFVEYNKV